LQCLKKGSPGKVIGRKNYKLLLSELRKLEKIQSKKGDAQELGTEEKISGSAGRPINRRAIGTPTHFFETGQGGGKPVTDEEGVQTEIWRRPTVCVEGARQRR